MLVKMGNECQREEKEVKTERMNELCILVRLKDLWSWVQKE
jgi:hypothetical protein